MFAERKFFDPKNDYAFKRLFGDERHKDILKAFLNDLPEGVQSPIEEPDLLPTNQDPEIARLRLTIVDVMCRDAEGKQYIVEVQCSGDSAFLQRACYYASRAYGRQSTAAGYRFLRPVIFLAIMKGRLFPEVERYLLQFRLDEIYGEPCSIKEFFFSFLEPGKINKTLKESRTVVDKWAYFLKHAPDTTSEEAEKIHQENPAIGHAYDVLRRYNYTTEELTEYDRYDLKADEIATSIPDAREAGKKEGKAEGLAEGREQGRDEAQRSIIYGMYDTGLGTSVIAQITGLSYEEAEKIIQEEIDRRGDGLEA